MCLLRSGYAPSGRDSTLDLIIGGALVLDPILGIFKGNIGIKDGRIIGVGRAGNPDIADAIDLVSGSNTGWIMAVGIIAPGGRPPRVPPAEFSSAPRRISSLPWLARR